ncbi:MAG TPA: HDIG domain-containing protein [Actinobacteria bacterium]|jgi:putative nucleotidyltransferase with HDIG domain|nr:HDIG domain-containing protein [Actinomycetota bacterium]
MDRNLAFDLLKRKVKNKNLIKHSLAVEAIMKEIAGDLNVKGFSIKGKEGRFDEDVWAITGLLHDIDYEETADDPLNHSLVSAEILKEEGYDDEIIYSIKAHNDVHGIPLKSEMDIALFSCDPVSGLIVASALIKPEKSLFAIDAEFVMNRYKEKSFAKGANRNAMLSSEKLGYSLQEFFEISLKGMLKISRELGL